MGVSHEELRREELRRRVEEALGRKSPEEIRKLFVDLCEFESALERREALEKPTDGRPA